MAKTKSFLKVKQGRKNPWIKAVMRARKELGIVGFVAINKGVEGKRLYKLAKKYHKK